MTTGVTMVAGGILAPRGFRAGSASAGLRERSAGDDVALVVADQPAAAVGFLTANRFAAAPVQIARSSLAATGGHARAVVLNAGCANAGTGPAGLEAAGRVVEAVAERLGCDPAEVLPASTGLIGSALPADRVARAAAQLRLGTAGDAATAAARSIMTTDTRPKESAARAAVRGQPITVGGMAKGAGMIHPAMATMLAVVTTDARVEPSTLRALAAPIVERTFNQVSVDGDTSTNDTLYLLASGSAGGEAITGEGEAAAAFAAALEAVCTDLARQIAADGEGATRRIDVTVSGAASDAEARDAARTVAGSNLVKAAVHGADPNWGRIAAAAGRSGATLDPERLRIWIGEVLTFAGTPCAFDPPAASDAMRGEVVSIRLDLGAGNGIGLAWGCDLSADYVAINSEYAT